ncbi:hypothetical protein TNCV_2131301 [Trichonephila clavipes]|nr:hypothetical protein TNCV_2131301 [Trichonephila clavipes]
MEMHAVIQYEWTRESSVPVIHGCLHTKYCEKPMFHHTSAACSMKEGKMLRTRVKKEYQEIRSQYSQAMRYGCTSLEAKATLMTWTMTSSLVKGKSVQISTEVQQAVRQFTALKGTEFCQSGFFILIASYDQCLNVGADYVKKQHKALI